MGMKAKRNGIDPLRKQSCKDSMASWYSWQEDSREMGPKSTLSAFS